MSNELVKVENVVASSREATLDETLSIAKILAQSGFFQDTRDAAQACAKILAGAEVGLRPVQSMMGVHLIKGRPSFAAITIAGLIKNSGKYNYKILKLDNTGCELEFFERSYNGTGQWESIGKSTFSVEDARKAQATGANWSNYPRNMFFARAITNGARWYCADVFGGPVYTPEELGSDIEMEAAPVQDSPSAPRPVDQEWMVVDPKQDVPKQSPVTNPVPTPQDERRQDTAALPTSTPSTPVLSPQAARIVQATQGMQKSTYADATGATAVENSAKAQSIPEAVQAMHAGATGVQIQTGVQSQKDNALKPGGEARVKFMALCRGQGIDTKDPVTMMGILSTILDREVTKGDLPSDDEWAVCAQSMENLIAENERKQQEDATAEDSIEGHGHVLDDDNEGVEATGQKPELVMPQRSPHDVSINQLVAAGVRPANKRGRVSQAELDAYWQKKGGAVRPQVEERQPEAEEQEAEEVYQCASQGCNNPVDPPTAQEAVRAHRHVLCRAHLDHVNRTVQKNGGGQVQATRVPAGPPPPLPRPGAAPTFTPVAVPTAIPAGARTAVPATASGPAPSRTGADTPEALMDARKRFVAAAREWGIDTGRENLLTECTKALGRVVSDHNTLTVADWEVCIKYIDPNNSSEAEEVDPFAE